ncbi:MAG: hypothetical protein HYV26_09250 [Candidatus Hydrogenedentes bacterium]|nr:hypothetical protein [Candidatus Hydrogenedentota bacterium]
MLKLLPVCLLLMATAAAPAAELEGGAFRVHYREGDEDVAQWSLDVLQEAAAEFAPRLPLGDAPVDVHIAHTMDEFRELTPGRNVYVSGVARSWRGMIIVKGPQLRLPGEDYAGTLRHELVHVLLYRNAGIGRLPQWLNEGLAMMLANELRWQASLTVGRMFLTRRIIEYKDLGRAFNAPSGPEEFSDVYAQSLSMTEFLRDRVGEDALWRIVLATREMSFGDALRTYAGMSPLDFWDAYSRSLWGLALIGSLVSGSLFTPAAVLFLIVYWKRRGQFKRGMARLEAQEARERAEAAEAPAVLSWDDVAEDPDAWKGEEGEEEEEER